MIILDKPYVSPLLLQTIVENNIPVLRSNWLAERDFPGDVTIWETETAVRQLANAKEQLVYSNSENALGWMVNHLGFSDLPEKIALFKDKVLFRELMKPLYPDFNFQEVSLNELNQLDFARLSPPLIVKPAIGFFSMGVYKVTSQGDWQETIAAISQEMQAVRALYPEEVLDTTRFMLETCVRGEEFAIDAFYDASGQVVLLNVLHHLFSSAEDVSDRVYITSREIIAQYRTRFVEFLTEVGRLANLRNFPVHAEVRIDPAGRIVPIEINPMRFAGWCTTDIAYHAYGINPYTSYFSQAAPDWERILAGDDDHVYSIVVLDMPRAVEAASIQDFAYGMVWASFESPLEIRHINYHEYPVFGFVFTKTRKNNLAELHTILRSDLTEYIQ